MSNLKVTIKDDNGIDCIIENILTFQKHLKEFNKKSPIFNRKISFLKVTSKSYERNPYVSEYAKRRAKGIWQLCELPAPFFTNDRKPNLETHHINWLANGSDHDPDNTVALCPNCHGRMHSLNKNRR